jgi:hypothetical protein
MIFFPGFCGEPCYRHQWRNCNSQVTSNQMDAWTTPVLTGQKIAADRGEIGTRWQARVFWSAFDNHKKKLPN